LTFTFLSRYMSKQSCGFSPQWRSLMPTRLSVPNQRKTVTKGILLCCGCVGLSFLAIVGFGLLQRTQASDNTLPDHHVHAAPTKIQPKLVPSYGKLPLSFEANQGQVRGPVQFLSRGLGYTIFLTDDEAVLTLRKSQPGMSRFGKFGFPGRPEPFGSLDPRGGHWPSLAGDLKSLWPSLIPDLSQLVPEPNAGKGGVAGGLESQPPQVLRMRLVGGNAKGRVVGLDKLPGRSNYFIGNDPKKWRTNVPSYARVKYEGVYPGVDLVYYGKQRQLEYDFVVAPGADPNQIKLSFAGGDGTRLDAASGDLVLKVGGDEVRFQKPAVYQPAVAAASRLGARHSSLVTRHCSFVLASNNEVAFRVAGYDPKRALVIDPVLTYSTYLGGTAYDEGDGIAVDTAGNAYVTGQTFSADFPTANPLQPSFGGGNDVFVAKLNPSGSALVYSTYLGGSVYEVGTGIAVDPAGNAYVTGWTKSTDFPTANPLQGTCSTTCSYDNADAFVAKLNAAGSALVYSTYLGGSGTDEGFGIAVDATGNAYVVGGTGSTDFPTANPLQPSFGGLADVFVAKLNPAGSALVYSTYLGGSDLEVGNGIAVDPAGNAYVTGLTHSTDFPTANPLQATCGGGCSNSHADAFVAKLNPAGSALIYSTYLGGPALDEGDAIAVDTAGNAYVTGYTGSTDFPTANPLQPSYGGDSWDAFVAKLNPAGSALVYSTYLGGSNRDGGRGIALDASGNAYVTGGTASTDFPTLNPIQGTCNNCSSSYLGLNYPDAFVAKLNSAGSALVYSTYLGGSGLDYGYGIAVDSAGNAYVTGTTASTDFPTANPLQPNYGGGDSDAFVAKISPGGAGPSVSLSRLSLTFGPQNVGTTSALQTVTVTDTGNASLTISSITASGDFSQTNNCGSSLSTGANCTINVTFNPTAPGTQTGTLTITDNAPGSPQTVTLTGTGVGPVVSLSPPMTFSQLVGTTSSSQTVTLTNTGNASLTFTAISLTGPFAIAISGTPCSTSNPVAAAATCTVAVTFTPTAEGTASGNLSFSDNAPNSPQTVALSGTGQDFTLAASSGSSTSATAAPGQTATYTLSVGGQGGLNQAVTFTCTGAPSEATCTVSPSPVTPGSSATNITVSVTTTAASVSAPRSRPLPPAPPLSPGVRGLLMVAMALTAVAWAIGRRNQPGVSRWKSAMVPLASALLLTLALAGCGGGGGSANVTHNPGTPAGNYTLTVTGSAGSGSSALSHSVTLTLIVS
jgi:hypothetical protein